MRQRGFTLIEMMVGILIGMALIAGLAITFANSSQSYGEMQKQSQQIESGRYAFDVLRDDLEHVGFLGARTQLPTVPGAEPDPCAFALADLTAGIALPIQAPGSGSRTSPTVRYRTRTSPLNTCASAKSRDSVPEALDS